MFLFILLSVCGLILLYIYCILHKNKNYWQKRGIVQVNKDAWNFLFKQSLSEVYKKLYDNYRSQSYIGTFIGMKPALILRKLEDIQAVLCDFQNFHARGYKSNKGDVLADNLLLIDDFLRWKLIRTKLSPTFTGSRLKNMFSIIERCANDFTEYIETNHDARRDLFEALHVFTLASISASVFGISAGPHNTMESYILKKGHDKISSIKTFNLKFAFSNICPQLSNLLNLKIFSEHEKFYLDIFRQVLNYRSNVNDKYHDFIETCLELKGQEEIHDSSNGYKIPVSDEILAAQAFSFVIAGVDTSANSLNFTLLELSKNTNILKRLHDEIDEVFDRNNNTITYESLKNMKYLEMIINESMRKYPPIGLIQRMCTRDTTLPSENLTIEKDTLVIIPVFAIHRDDQYFPNPEIYDPERFSVENMSNIVKFSYLPFAEGQRICIGARFALLQMKACLAALLRKYTLKGQNYSLQSFEPSFFGLRDSKACYDLIARNCEKLKN